jgi:hypothetical protein
MGECSQEIDECGAELLQARRNRKKCALQMEGIVNFTEGKLNFPGGESVFIVAGRIL